MANPIWKTPINLGTYDNNTVFKTFLVASPVPPAVGITYELIGGILPTGLSLSNTGLLTGTLTTLYTNNTSNFTIKATDNLGNSSIRSFTLTVIITPSQPNWVTPQGSIGTFPANYPVVFNFDAQPVLPATTITYKLLSGRLPDGFQISTNGILTGTTNIVSSEISYSFAIRAIDDLDNIRDRSFSLTISGSATPEFTIPSGSILNTLDSIWVELAIPYNNPIPSNEVTVVVTQGFLPPGLEINEAGVIRGYADPPINSVTLPQIITSATETISSTNTIVCLSTQGFTVGRRVVFSGITFGGLESGFSYYIKSIESPTSFTVTTTENGSIFNLNNASGFMTTTLPAVSAGQPSIKTYNFTLELQSLYGNNTANYVITVINQNTPISQGGPGLTPNTRVPTIFNYRPPSYNIPPDNLYYGYYLPATSGLIADIGTYQSDNYFAYKIIGHDFDGSDIRYSFSDLPLGLVGDPITGWISGTPVVNIKTLNQYSFSVAVYKENIPSIISPYFGFTMQVSKEIVGTVIWNTDNDLGTIYNGTISTLFVHATSDVDLQYRIVDGELPPNLEILSNGEITGYVADQPTSTLLNSGDTTNYTFTVQAYSPLYPYISSSKTFNLTVLQEFSQPTDILYMKCTPSIDDRLKIDTLLDNENLIPETLLYRPKDKYFGKASSVIYPHAYGIYASSLDQYIAAVTRNHYWRNITLGELKTAVAKNSSGEIIYEVVYSQIIDNLTKPSEGPLLSVVNAAFLIEGQTYTIVYPGTTDFTKVGAVNSNSGTVFVATGSGTGSGTAATSSSDITVSSEIYWPNLINLNLGPWYTSSTSIFTSYEDIQNQLYYTSLSPGYARTLYPNSLANMRNRVGEVLGQEFNSKLLPLWMTSQQSDGSTTGYVPAWVICYTKPGYSSVVKNNIEKFWPYQLNQINFKLDRFSVDKSNTYNYDDNFNPPSWTSLPSATPVPNPLDSKDFYVLFPRQTILPDQTQY